MQDPSKRVRLGIIKCLSHCSEARVDENTVASIAA